MAARLASLGAMGAEGTEQCRVGKGEVVVFQFGCKVRILQ